MTAPFLSPDRAQQPLSTQQNSSSSRNTNRGHGNSPGPLLRPLRRQIQQQRAHLPVQQGPLSLGPWRNDSSAAELLLLPPCRSAHAQVHQRAASSSPHPDPAAPCVRLHGRGFTSPLSTTTSPRSSRTATAGSPAEHSTTASTTATRRSLTGPRRVHGILFVSVFSSFRFFLLCVLDSIYDSMCTYISVEIVYIDVWEREMHICV